MNVQNLTGVNSAANKKAAKKAGNKTSSRLAGDSFVPGEHGDSDVNRLRKAARDILDPSKKAVVRPEVLWEYDTGGKIQASPVVSDNGALYVTNRSGKALALDVKTGAKKWELDTKERMGTDPLAGGNGLVYICEESESSCIHALDENTGKEAWSFSLHGVPGRSMSKDPDGTIYAGSSIFTKVNKIGGVCTGGLVFALEGDTGRKKWEFRATDMVVSAPTPGPDNLLSFGTYDNRFFVLDKKTGKKKWETKADGFISSSPAYGKNGHVYFGDWTGKLYSYDVKTGKKKWEFKAKADFRSNPVVDKDGTVIAGSLDNNVYALDSATGKVKWKAKTKGQVFASPVLDNRGNVFVGSNDGVLYAFDAKSGMKKWEFKTKDKVFRAPTVGPDGNIYVGSEDNKIYALNPEKLERLIEDVDKKSDRPKNDGPHSVEVTDDFVIIDGVKLPRRQD